MQSRTRTIGGVVIMLLALGAVGWLLWPAPPAAPPAPPPAPKEAVAPRVQRLAPAPQPVDVEPDAVAAIEAIADTLKLPMIRCSLPPEVDARMVSLGAVTWDGPQVTAAVATSSGRFPVQHADLPMGAKAAGWLEWEGALPGVVTPCRYTPPTEVVVTFRVIADPPLERPAVLACGGMFMEPVVDGVARLQLTEGEICDVMLREEGGLGRVRRTRAGQKPLIRPFSDMELTLEVVERTELSAAELQAIAEAASERAIAAMTEPARARIDYDAVLSRDDLTPGARAWLEARRR
ncbi:MAG: hypothetical protein H6736_17960 [Alphaproteobacteria bacterium]|nr:hypothetical protein [Alphaproteobacteria bacterium]